MSHFYYEVYKEIRKNISFFQILILQYLQLFFYIWFSIVIVEFFRNKISENLIYSSIIILLIARGFSIYFRHKIYLVTPIIKKAFPEKDRTSLVKEIEQSLQSFLDFTKWSCGIFTTILVFVANGFINVYIKFFDKYISVMIAEKEVSKMIEDFNFDTTSIFYSFILLTTTISGTILLYYFIIQLFAYNRKLVLKILKNCEYDIKYHLLEKNKWQKLTFFISELFFWNYF